MLATNIPFYDRVQTFWPPDLEKTKQIASGNKYVSWDVSSWDLEFQLYLQYRNHTQDLYPEVNQTYEAC